MNGIYILANDVVLDQAIALLNSIEANAGLGPDGQPYPVLVLPYDDRLDRLRAALADYPNAQLFEDWAAIARWEQAARDIWDVTPGYRELLGLAPGEYHRMGMHRRFCALDGPFENFIYLDGDTLVLDSLAPLFDKLYDYEWVVYDFQHKDPSHVFNVHSPKLPQVFPPERLEIELFCAGMYAGRRGLFGPERLAELLERLKAGEAEILYARAPDQSILNYWVMRSGQVSVNLARELPPEQVTGCCVTSPHFQERTGKVFDRDRPLIYLHYIGVPATYFTQLCAGENLEIPYRETFLHYRYRRSPGDRPQFRGQPRPYQAPPSLWSRAKRKLAQFWV